MRESDETSFKLIANHLQTPNGKVVMFVNHLVWQFFINGGYISQEMVRDKQRREKILNINNEKSWLIRLTSGVQLNGLPTDGLMIVIQDSYIAEREKFFIYERFASCVFIIL